LHHSASKANGSEIPKASSTSEPPISTGAASLTWLFRAVANSGTTLENNEGAHLMVIAITSGCERKNNFQNYSLNNKVQYGNSVSLGK
jgi:hypothetical protein